MKKIFSKLAALIFIALPFSVNAIEYGLLIPQESHINFVSTQMKVKTNGAFKKFSAQLTFDPKKLQHAQANITIDTASIDVGSAPANEEVVGKNWFDTKQYPKVLFHSTAIQLVKDGIYQIQGELTIKGKKQPISVPVTLHEANGKATFEGSFTINRLDFGLGVGQWADVDTVANEVQIKFHLQFSRSHI